MGLKLTIFWLCLIYVSYAVELEENFLTPVPKRCEFDPASHLGLNCTMREATSKICPHCIAKTKVDFEDLRKVEEGIDVDKHSVRCYFRCYMVLYGAMTEKGDFFLDGIKGYLPDHLYKLLTEYCAPKAMKEKDLCRRSYSLYKCFIDKGHRACYVF